MISLYGFNNPYQLSLPCFYGGDLLSNFPRKALGVLGEMTVWKALQESGYVVSRAPIFEGDLRAIDPDGVIYRVEVKTARQDSRGNWQFCIYRSKGRVCTDFRHADLLVLLPVVEMSVIPFVVPSAVITASRQITMTSHPAKYRGKLAVYRQPDLPLLLEY